MNLRRTFLPAALPAACLLASVSCSTTTVRSTQAQPTTPVKATRPTAVKAAIEQQVRVAHEVRNAVAAGEGDFEAHRLRELLVVQPGNMDTRLRLAARYEELDLPEFSTEHYRLAAERNPSEVAPQIGLARSLHRQGRTHEAAATMEQYLTAYAEAPAEAHSWAGIFRDALGHHKVAEQHHRDALEHAAAAAAYLRNNLGQNLTLQARGGEAISEFRAALELEPANVMVRNNLAIALSADPAEAARVFETGTKDPATAHNNLAAILIEQGRYQEARKELNLALGYKPDLAPALANLALMSDLDGKPAQMLLPSRAPQLTASARGNHGGLRKVGRAIAKVFIASETRQPEQTASAAPHAGKKGKRPSD
jgi:Flp pilus assembly protein TadD